MSVAMTKSLKRARVYEARHRPLPRTGPDARHFQAHLTVNATRVSRHVNAPRARVYNALIDPKAIAKWKVPSGMTSHVHEFEGREGGTFRISLTYEGSTEAGKTSAHTDTYHGRLMELVADERVVEIDELGTAHRALQGQMKATGTV